MTYLFKASIHLAQPTKTYHYEKRNNANCLLSSFQGYAQAGTNIGLPS